MGGYLLSRVLERYASKMQRINTMAFVVDKMSDLRPAGL